MDVLTALAAIRQLDALPEARRRYLAVLAADARTDADRARIVFEARHEDRRVREKADADFSAELQTRARWADRNPQRLPESHTEPSKRRYGLAEGVRFPAHRPVIVSWTPSAKTGTQQPERRPMNGPVRHHGSEPGTKDLQFPTRKHGTAGTYNLGCRCDPCCTASAEYGRAYRARKKAEKLNNVRRAEEREQTRSEN